MEKKLRIKRKRKISIEKREFSEYLDFAYHVLNSIEKELGEHIISSKFLGRIFKVKTLSGVYNYTVEFINSSDKL